MIRVMQEVFRTMLRSEAQTVSGAATPALSGVCAQVHFGGAWDGTLLVQCSTSGARQLARLFAGDEFDGDFEVAECHDVLGELANIVAGNLKAVLPRGTEVSHPIAVDGSLGPPDTGKVPIAIQTFMPTHRDPVSLILAVGR